MFERGEREGGGKLKAQVMPNVTDVAKDKLTSGNTVNKKDVSWVETEVLQKGLNLVLNPKLIPADDTVYKWLQCMADTRSRTETKRIVPVMMY